LAGFEPPLDRPSDGPHVAGETCMRQRAVADPMPPVKHLVHLDLQGFPKRLGWSTPLRHGRDIPPQMCPADLAPPGGIL